MGKTSRFHSDLWDERERESERYRKIVEMLNSMCVDDPQRASRVIHEVDRLVAEADRVFERVWLDVESDIRTGKSEILDAVSEHICEILNREHERWTLRRVASRET